MQEMISFDVSPYGDNRRMMLFSGRANPALAARIAHELNCNLGQVKLKSFSNGEVYCRFEESVRGADVFIVQPMCSGPNEEVDTNGALM
jgi:ribose-phosphate pyrophosphokinase